MIIQPSESSTIGTAINPTISLPDIPPGTRVGQWLIEEFLGSGATADVYRAKNDLNIMAAVKFMKPSANKQRLNRERTLVARQHHLHVCSHLDSGTHQGIEYISLEFANGGSLKGYLTKHGTVAPPMAAWILAQACAGLRATNTLHRDLKPDNLLVHYPDPDGAQDFRIGDTSHAAVLKVSDFGLARCVFDPNSTMGGTSRMSSSVMGTPHYMAPEQCQDMDLVTVQSDIYSLGIVLYQMILGSTPFSGRPITQILRAHIDETPAFPSTLPSAIAKILHQALAKNPRDRQGEILVLENQVRQVAGLVPINEDGKPRHSLFSTSFLRRLTSS